MQNASKSTWRKPVFPGLEAWFVQDVVKRFPVVEDFIAVVDDVGGCTQVSQEPKCDKRKQEVKTLILAAFLFQRLVLLGVSIRRRRGNGGWLILRWNEWTATGDGEGHGSKLSNDRSSPKERGHVNESISVREFGNKYSNAQLVPEH